LEAQQAREVGYSERVLDVRVNWAMKNAILAAPSFG
jgi:hypothetical protein